MTNNFVGRKNVPDGWSGHRFAVCVRVTRRPGLLLIISQYCLVRSRLFKGCCHTAEKQVSAYLYYDKTNTLKCEGIHTTRVHGNSMLCPTATAYNLQNFSLVRDCRQLRRSHIHSLFSVIFYIDSLTVIAHDS